MPTATGSNLACRRIQCLAWFGFPGIARRYLASCGDLEARLAESARCRSSYFAARSLPLRFLAVNAIRIGGDLRACIF